MSSLEFDVDAAYCVSLKERTDRRAVFKETIEPLIKNKVEFHVVERDSDPVRGCYESHQNIAREALNKGYERVLIFEDDVASYPISPSQVVWINKFVRREQFNILHLGYSMGKSWLTWFPYIARGRVVAMHAYILSREGCRALVDAPYDGVPVDVLFKRKVKQHCTFPMLFRQHPAALTGSDIELIVKNEDEWWQKNWKKHWMSPIKNIWRTIFRVGF